MILPISGRQISRKLHTRRGSASCWILLERNFQNLPCKGLFFPKAHVFWSHRERLPTSDRDMCEMITNLGKSLLVGAPMECWLSVCTIGINPKSFPWPPGCVQETTFLDIAGSSVYRASDVMSQSHSRGGANNSTSYLDQCIAVGNLLTEILCRSGIPFKHRYPRTY